MYNERRIDLDALGENYRTVCRLAGGRTVIAVLKANAYGHGAPAVGKHLRALGCAHFAVASLAEALDLSPAVGDGSILILSPTPTAALPTVAAHRFLQSIPSLAYARAASERLKGDGLPPLSVHLKLDAGMHRLGFSTDEKGIAEAAEAASLPCLAVSGIYAHLSSADAPTDEANLLQANRFLEAVSLLRLRGIAADTVHLAASEGISLAIPPFSHLRAGLSLYGYSASFGALLRPVMSLSTRIVQLRTLPPGEAVGYGGSVRTKRRTRLAVLPIGYADGLCRCLSGSGSVFIGDGHAPFFGRICMDLSTVDVTDLPNVKVGDPVILFDAAHPITRLSNAAGTIPYELLLAFSHARVREASFVV